MIAALGYLAIFAAVPALVHVGYLPFAWCKGNKEQVKESKLVIACALNIALVLGSIFWYMDGQLPMPVTPHVVSTDCGNTITPSTTK